MSAALAGRERHAQCQAADAAGVDFTCCAVLHRLSEAHAGTGEDGCP